MKIFIHNNNGDFVSRWVKYCEDNKLDYSLVNCLSNDIISKVSADDILLWRWHHCNAAEVMAACDIIRAAISKGVRVFPDYNTCCTYDNKIAQKYELEAINAPLVSTYVFFNKAEALKWADETDYPKVFKLSKGAGAKNVSLARSRAEAVKLINTAFGKGFRPVAGHLKDAIGKLSAKSSRSKIDWAGKIKRLPSSLLNIYRTNRSLGRERGYVYFQEFIPESKYDTRITVVGGKAFGFIRYVRKNDFRASGSGDINYDISEIDLECVKIAFDVAKKLKSQSIAFDFVKDPDGRLYIVETSYSYVTSAVHNSEGYWDEHLQWHAGHYWPEDIIIKSLL